MRLFSPDFAHNYFLEKQKLYHDFGYDILKERSAFLDWIEVLKGPIVELGTGRGYFTVLLAQRFDDIVSVDVDSEMLEFAGSLLQFWGLEDKVRLLKSSGYVLPFASDSVGSVICFNMWHHIGDPELFLREIRRVIKPKGLLAISDFSDEGFDMVEQIHQKVYNQAHSVERRNFDEIIGFFSECQKFYYSSRYQKGICILVEK